MQAVVGKLWRNTQGQLSFLCHAMVAPPDVFTFEHALRKLAPLDGLHGSKSAVGLPNHAWLCLDLYDTLSRLAEAGHRPAVHQCLEHPAKNCPEVRTTFTCAEPILRRHLCKHNFPDALAATRHQRHLKTQRK